jgi:hypothetical protein
MAKTMSILAAAAVLVFSAAFAFWNEGEARKSSCSKGTDKFVHVCIEKTARGAAKFKDASTACATEKRRLPTSAELDAFRQQPDITLADEGEWVSDLTSDTSAIVMVDAGGFANASLVNTVPFRCVA